MINPISFCGSKVDINKLAKKFPIKLDKIGVKGQAGSEPVRIFTKGSSTPGDIMSDKTAQEIVNGNIMKWLTVGKPAGMPKMQQLILPADTTIEEATKMFDRIG